MPRSIDQDLKRFNEIIRGRIRRDLRRYINHGEMLGRKGRETVSIPVPNIDIRTSSTDKKAPVEPDKAKAKSDSRSEKARTKATVKARPAANPVHTSAKSKSRSMNWPKCSDRTRVAPD